MFTVIFLSIFGDVNNYEKILVNLPILINFMLLTIILTTNLVYGIAPIRYPIFRCRNGMQGQTSIPTKRIKQFSAYTQRTKNKELFLSEFFNRFND